MKTDFVPGKPRLAYDHAGEGPALVFLHGVGGNRTNWRDQLEVCADRFHAIAWDARGYGLSDDYDGPLDFADFSHDLKRLLDHLGLRSAHICGLSMGGRVALDFHSFYQERVASLILCDTFAGYDESFTPAQRQDLVRTRKAPLIEGKEPRDIAPEVARTLIGPKSPAAAFERFVESMSALRKESYIKAIEALTMYEKVAPLTDIEVPTLLIYGSADRLTPVRIGQAMAAKIRGSRMAIIEGAGHLPNIETPDQFNVILLEFLRTHRDCAM